MHLKNKHSIRTSLSPFDLLGSDENALSKAFAYMLSCDASCYKEFLKLLGYKTNGDFNNVEILTQKYRDEGITDIELTDNLKYHIIIECKVRSGKILAQRTQYINSFDKQVPKKILCFLTQERDTNSQIQDGVVIKNTSWLDIIDLYSDRKFSGNEIVTMFIKFATKNYKMRTLKEVLIQDLKIPLEIERFKEFAVYRRDQTFGTPIYFAPYFTRGATSIEGISTLSKILGILTLKSKDIDLFQHELENFSTNRDQVQKWINGVKLNSQGDDTIYTFYFLDEAFVFKSPLMKERGNHKEVGKGWISKFIPKNRCVSFVEFIKRIPELNS
jgi:hypothetical protein